MSMGNTVIDRHSFMRLAIFKIELYDISALRL